MNKIDVLNKIITKALKNGFDWEMDYEDWQEISDLEKAVVLRQLVDESINVYLILIFDRQFAKALWGDEKYMAYYAGYDEWSDATDFTGESEGLDYDEIPRDRMPLFEYHLMMLARPEDRFKYLEENA